MTHLEATSLGASKLFFDIESTLGIFAKDLSLQDLFI